MAFFFFDEGTVEAGQVWKVSIDTDQNLENGYEDTFSTEAQVSDTLNSLASSLS